MIDELKEKKKQDYLLLYINKNIIECDEDWFMICNGLGDIAKDEGCLAESIDYFLKAKAIGSQPSYAYSYKHVLFKIIVLYIETNQLAEASRETAEMLLKSPLCPLAMRAQAQLNAILESQKMSVAQEPTTSDVNKLTPCIANRFTIFYNNNLNSGFNGTTLSHTFHS